MGCCWGDFGDGCATFFLEDFWLGSEEGVSLEAPSCPMLLVLAALDEAVIGGFGEFG